MAPLNKVMVVLLLATLVFRTVLFLVDATGILSPKEHLVVYKMIELVPLLNSTLIALIGSALLFSDVADFVKLFIF